MDYNDPIFRSYMEDNKAILDNFEAIKGKNQRVLVQIMVMLTLQNVMLKILSQNDNRIPWDFLRETQGAVFAGIGFEILGISKEDAEEIMNVARTIVTKFFEARQKKAP